MRRKGKTRAAAAGARPEFYVICQNIRSLFNVGTIFRTGDCFGVTKIFLTGYTGTPPRKEISKVALGAEDWIPWEHHGQPARLIKKLKAAGVRIVALEQVPGRSVDVNAYQPQFPMALLLGYEVDGLPARLIALADDVIEIPMYGRKESLNVGVAFGIAANRIAAKGHEYPLTTSNRSYRLKAERGQLT